MNKLKVAILEDSKVLLKELKLLFDESGLVEVVAWALNSEDFLDKVSKQTVEALILDIDLSGDSMNGLDIAHRIQLPVLFVSGKTKDFYASIEDLNMNSDSIIEHISKPITTEKLNKILPKFIKQVRLFQKSLYIHLDFHDSKRNKINLNDIVYLESDKRFGAESNNKRIHFAHRPPETLVDFSFVKMEEIGMSKHQFIQTHRSFRVNHDHILQYNNSSHTVQVRACDTEGKSQLIQVPVSENYRKLVLKKFN